MAIIHDVAAPGVTIAPATRQGQQMSGTEIEVKPVIMQPDAQAVADQARRHGVEDPLQDEATRRGDGDSGLLTIRGAARRQRLKHGAPGIDTLAVMGIAPTAERVEEPAAGGEIAEVGRPAQQERIRDRPLQVPMWPLNRAILMRRAIAAPSVRARWRGPRLLRLGAMA